MPLASWWIGGCYSERNTNPHHPCWKISLENMIRLGEGGMLLIVAFLFCSMLRTQNDLVFSYASVKDFLHNLQIFFFLLFFPPVNGMKLMCFRLMKQGRHSMFRSHMPGRAVYPGAQNLGSESEIYPSNWNAMKLNCREDLPFPWEKLYFSNIHLLSSLDLIL